MNTQTPSPETDAARQLREAATAIETYRADLGMTKAVLLREYPELGTDKTYGKIIKGDFAELDIEARWLPAYKDAWDRMQGEDADDDSELLDKISGPVELCRAYLETRNERGNARFILVLGDSGVGKTSAIRALKAKPYGNQVFDLEATEVWKNKNGRGSSVPLLRALGRKLGIKDMPSGRGEILNVIVENLQGRRRCIVIEEAHHLCPEGINCLKTLINLTPSIIIATAMPVLWEKISGSRHAWAECKQLKGNRLAEVVHLQLTLADIEQYLTARLADLSPSKEWLEAACKRLLIDAPRFGNMSFVKSVVKRFKREVRAGQDASQETLASVIANEKKRR